MLNLFRKKKEESRIPEPPRPSDTLAEDGMPHIPDNHPLDQPIEKPFLSPSTDFGEAERAEIDAAIDRVQEPHGPMGIEQPLFDVKQFQNTPQDVEEDDLPIEEPEEESQETEEIEEPVQSDEQDEPLSDDDLPSFGQEDIAEEQVNEIEKQEVEIPRQQGFGIYIDLGDYERIFKEIHYIDSFSKKCFRAVLNLKDISGNQNKLLEKFQNDLEYVNERLSFMDQAFFEQKR